MSGIKNTSPWRFSSTRSASGVVGPFAPSASTRHLRFSATCASITRSIAAGTSTSQDSVRICSGSNVSWLEKPAMLPCVPHQRRNIAPGRIMQRAGVIADGDDLQAVLMQLQRRIGADIAKALDHGGRGARIDRQLLQDAPGEIGDAAPRGFAPAERATRRYRLAGDDLGHGAALVHR